MYSRILVLLFILSTSWSITHAGNPDRVGQAGSDHLLMNPWVRSGGWHGAFTAGIMGVEAMRFNVGGLTKIDGSEFLLARTNYLLGFDNYINAFGFATKVGASQTGALGVSFMQTDYGEIERTNIQNPNGGIGTFRPQFINIGISYAKEFSNAISGGATLRMISESMTDINGLGVAIDAGIQYQTDITGRRENSTKFGISLRNVGTPIRYTGSGLSNRAQIEGSDYSQTLSMRSETFELPSLLNIGASQDIFFSGDSLNKHKITVAANFTSNTFTSDQFQGGLQYSLKDIVAVRAGVVYERDIFNADVSNTVHAGPSGGFSLNLPVRKEVIKEDDDGNEKTVKEDVVRFGLDYSYQHTHISQGIHSLGVRIQL